MIVVKEPPIEAASQSRIYAALTDAELAAGG
jgi:hypothetical protein